MDPKKDYSDLMLNVGLNTLSPVYANPVKVVPWKQYLFGTCFYLYTLVQYGFIFMKLRELDGSDIKELSETLSSFSSYFQITLKLLPLIFQRESFKRMVTNRNYFWRPDPERYPELCERINGIHFGGYVFASLFRTLVAFLVLAYFTRPYFSHQLFALVWVPDLPYAFEIILIGQYIQCPLTVCLIIGSDVLFVSFCLDAVAQFTVLSHYISQLGKTGNTGVEEIAKLNSYIKQHKFLLDYVGEIERLFKFSVLGNYFITILACCMQFYSLTDDSTIFSDLIIGTLQMAGLLMQFAFYCFSSSELTQAISEVSDAFYDCNWVDLPASARKILPFCIMRSQKEFTIKAGGMLEINNNAFIKVVKAAFSFLTLMRSLKE